MRYLPQMRCENTSHGNQLIINWDPTCLLYLTLPIGNYWCVWSQQIDQLTTSRGISHKLTGGISQKEKAHVS